VTKLTATGRATSPEQPQPTGATTPGQTIPAGDSDESGGSRTIVIIIAAVLLLAAAGVLLLIRRGRS
jgi:MYXO-CTERM domain-containing protein